MMGDGLKRRKAIFLDYCVKLRLETKYCAYILLFTFKI